MNGIVRALTALTALFGRRKLSDLRRPERVRAVGVITSPSDLTSPLTGLRGAAFHVALFERYSLDRNSTAEAERVHLAPLGQVVIGERILITSEPEGLVIDVPLSRARFLSRSNRAAAMPLEVVPPELGPLTAQATGRGLMCYQELVLGPGDRVALLATLEPQGGSGQGGYRSMARAALVARPDQAIEIEEILEVPSW